MLSTHAHIRFLPMILLAAATCLPGCGPRALCDCAWAGTVTAWFDANENGVREEGESALPGVTIRSSHGESDVTNPNGEAAFDIWSPGCPCGRGLDLRFEAEPPKGYRHTTLIEIDADRGDPQFGFAFDPASATMTPNPIRLSCTSYYGEPFLGDPFVTDLAIDSAGHVWASTLGGGVSEYLPAQDAWRRSPAQRYALSLAVAQDGSIWAGGFEDVVVLNRAGSRSFRSACPLQQNSVSDIAFDEEGMAWLATPHGALRMDPQSGDCSLLTCASWREGPSSEGYGPDSVDRITVTSDGSVWLLTSWHILSRVDPLGASSDSHDCLTYSAYTTESDQHHLPFEPQTISAGIGDALWLAGYGALARLEMITGHVTLFDLSAPLTGSSYSDLVVYEDGSLLLGSSLGLLRYWPDDLAGATHPPLLYDSSDGVSHNDVLSISVDVDGSIWLGTVNGLSHCSFQNP